MEGEGIDFSQSSGSNDLTYGARGVLEKAGTVGKELSEGNWAVERQWMGRGGRKELELKCGCKQGGCEQQGPLRGQQQLVRGAKGARGAIWEVQQTHCVPAPTVCTPQ